MRRWASGTRRPSSSRCRPRSFESRPCGRPTPARWTGSPSWLPLPGSRSRPQAPRRFEPIDPGAASCALPRARVAMHPGSPERGCAQPSARRAGRFLFRCRRPADARARHGAVQAVPSSGQDETRAPRRTAAMQKRREHAAIGHGHQRRYEQPALSERRGRECEERHRASSMRRLGGGQTRPRPTGSAGYKEQETYKQTQNAAAVRVVVDPCRLLRPLQCQKAGCGSCWGALRCFVVCLCAVRDASALDNALEGVAMLPQSAALRRGPKALLDDATVQVYVLRTTYYDVDARQTQRLHYVIKFQRGVWASQEEKERPQAAGEERTNGRCVWRAKRGRANQRALLAH